MEVAFWDTYFWVFLVIWDNILTISWGKIITLTIKCRVRTHLKVRQCTFAILLLSPLCKGRGPSFEQTWVPFTQGCFVPSLFEIGPMVLESKMWKIYRQMNRPTEDGKQVIRKALIRAFSPGEINVSIVLFVSKNHTVHRFNIVEYHTYILLIQYMQSGIASLLHISIFTPKIFVLKQHIITDVHIKLIIIMIIIILHIYVSEFFLSKLCALIKMFPNRHICRE